MRRELVVVLAIGCGRVNFDPVGGSGSPNDGDVIGDIERGDGFVTSGCGALPIRVSSAGIRARKPAIAWSGTELAYVWIEDATTDTIHF
ncbi:MAG TPA: hypothetical protein VL326_09625, partial [Kofleriaceae bacterium]|nr:hypothetical protein [Kofleriaceae bacterium]